ncbi:MAG TPA: mycofactocin biosynthesis chaperone MftB [Pseudonocardia sp.]|uniref:mycofactocin biosynthesis chaperone MftB n=1 Tax=Pseudonocardia sp. TaxID=60912 RepID=UPI002F42F461
MSTSQRPSPATFDPDLPYRCSPSVALRPEPFGALVYHFGTRKLSFLKTQRLVEVVSVLDQHPCAHEAIDAAGVAPEQRTAYLRALAGLAEAGTIERRDPTDQSEVS